MSKSIKRRLEAQVPEFKALMVEHDALRAQLGRVRELVVKWRERKNVPGPHSPFGIGWERCAGELEAALKEPGREGEQP